MTQDFLVQRLPNLPNLRALHIGTINNLESIRQTENTLAHRLLDMVTLMPCLPLTYIGILDECYKIARDEPIDNDDDYDDASATEDDMSNTVTDIPVAFDSDDESDPPLPVDNEVFLDSDDEGDLVLDEPVWFDYGEEEEEEDSEQGLGGKFWLRVSFNDDKAEIFKARHGEL